MRKRFKTLPKRLLESSFGKMQFFLMLGLMLAFGATAQTNSIKITGKVVDENNAAFASVSVTVKGTNNGTSTKEDGTYNISVPNTNAILVFTYVGYEDLEQKVGTNTTINIALKKSANDLNDVVVIGYGTVKRKDLTGSVFSVKSADITRTPTHNAVEAIQGRVPGVDLTRNSGEAGGGVNIAVRGNRSLLPDAGAPLFIIDGFQGGSISDINPNDIDDITILKDASATAIYGALGANGVFIVTTKKGKSGVPKVSYDGFYGINSHASYPKLLTGDAYIKLRREAYRTAGEWNTPADDINIFTADEYDAIQRNEWVDWYKLLVSPGQQQSHNISLRGGNEKTKAFLSAGYFKEQGMFTNDLFERFTLRTNIEQTVNNWVKVGINTQLTFTDKDRRTDALGLVNQTSPIAKAYDDNGMINQFPVYGNASAISPLADERGDTVYKNNTVGTRILANGFVELKLAKGLTFKSTFGTALGSSRLGIYQAATSVAQRNTRQTTTQQTTGMSKNFNFDNILTYTKNIGDHAITATGIHSYISSEEEGLEAIGYNQLIASQLFYNMAAVNPNSRFLSSSYERSNNLAFAGRLNYAYKSKYLLALTYRADGASRLSPDKRWDYFPSVSAAWNISDEDFMKNVSWIDNLKLRASYGTTGNYSINPYATQSTLNSFANLGFAEASQSYYYFNQYIGNRNLGWEKSTTTNIGVDFSLVKNRLSGSIEVYNVKTDGLLYGRLQPRSSGSVSNGVMFEIMENIGETNNKGIEIALNANIINKKDFNWNSTLTFTSNKEKITKLVDGQNIYNGTDPETKSLLLGHPVNSFYSFKKLGIWQTDEAAKAAELTFGNTPFKPGDMKIEDLNGDGIIDSKDQQFLGSTVPKFVLGWQNNVSYKNFDLGVYMFVRYGQTIRAEFLTRYNPSGVGNSFAEFDYWTPENPTNDFPRPTKGGQFINYPAYQGFNFVDGSFFKIKNVTLGYTFPQSVTSKLRVDKIRIYATANNFFTFSKSHLLRNYDPERGGGESNPLMRQIVFGVNLGL